MREYYIRNSSDNDDSMLGWICYHDTEKDERGNGHIRLHDEINNSSCLEEMRKYTEITEEEYNMIYEAESPDEMNEVTYEILRSYNIL